jgi:predicted nucleic acid-binding protein
MDADDKNHLRAKKQWEVLVLDQTTLVCTNYVLLESFALIQYRLGIKAARVFYEDITPILTVEWIDESIHREGVLGVLAATKKKLSLVDCISFGVMRRLGIKSVFTFDKHFKEQGFTCLP